MNLKEKFLSLLLIILVTISVAQSHKSSGIVINDNLSGPMDADSNQIKKIVYDINNLKDNDVLYLNINSPGGQLAAFIDINTAMQGHKGTVIAVLRLGNMAASAAAFTLVVSDVYIIEPGSFFMMHRPSKFVNCQSGKDPSFETCESKKLDDNDGFFDRWANELAMAIVQKAIDHCLVQEVDYPLIKAGEDVSHTGQDLINNLKTCKK